VGTFVIRGWIRLPSPQVFDDAVAIVGLDDVSKIDAPSIRVAEAIIRPIGGLLDRIPFYLTIDPNLRASDSYVLTAEIRCSKKERLSPGDFLATTAFPWSVSDRTDKTIDVSQI
jgi:uncharacterized lipoprotein YbaY